MKKIILSLTVLSFLFLSCNIDDEQVPLQESENGFFINSDFHKVNKAYYVPDLTTEKNDDF